MHFESSMAMKKTNKNNGKTTGPSTLSELVQDFLQVKMPASMGEEVRVFGEWPKAVGADISKQAQPKTFRNGILFVETRHPIWTTELQSKSHLIRKRLNDALGGDFVKEIHFRQARI